MENTQKWLSDNWLKVAAIAMVLGALASSFGALAILPFGYYQLMNWAVVGASLTSAWQAYQRKKTGVAWLFAFVAVVFNPITPIYLSATIWQYSDVAVVLLFLVSFFAMKERKA